MHYGAFDILVRQIPTIAPVAGIFVLLKNLFIYLFYLLMLYGKGQRSASNLCLQPNTQNVQLC